MLSKAETNDFVYLDPPYDPVSYTSDFTAYTPNGFGRENQVQLANAFRNLSDRRCLVLLSDSDTPFIRELYSDCSIKEWLYKGLLNARVQNEQVIRNYLFPTILRMSTANNLRPEVSNDSDRISRR